MAGELGLPEKSVENSGCWMMTIRSPFIARYRKEMTGELDETQIRRIEQVGYYRNLEQRKEYPLIVNGETDRGSRADQPGT